MKDDLHMFYEEYDFCKDDLRTVLSSTHDVSCIDELLDLLRAMAKP